MSGVPDPPKKERKRPDVLQRLKDRKGKQERVVKCSLQGRLTEKKLMPEIQQWVSTISKITNKGSIVFNRLLLHCLNAKKQLPDLTDQTLYLQCFNIGVGRVVKSIPELEETWNSCFKDFPKLEKCRGDTQAYVYASKQYMTNFKNSLIYAFDGRQKAFIRHWCQRNSLTKEDSYAIRCAINQWGCKGEVPESATSFIEEQRTLLRTKDLKEGITHTWLGANMTNIVHYFYSILKYNEQFEDTRRFTLAPVSRIKRHFLTIDTTVLYEMMKNQKLTESTKEVFQELKASQFESVFRIKGLCNKAEFSHIVETDGISACFHFKVPKREVETGNRQLKKSNNRVIAIDPGRSNLIFGVEKLENGSTKTYKLTRNEFYTNAGMKTCNRKTAKWEKNIEAAELVFRQHSLKTINEGEWSAFLKDYSIVYKTLWEAKTQKKWARERFRVYCLRNKILDKFFQTMNGKEKPTIAYGAAKFNPNNKNELSAPTTYLSKRCAIHFPTVFVDEYNTTKVCSCCDSKLCPVVIDGQERRGLRWCCSTKCRTFLNRDLNAALNILRCFKSATARPYSLCRNSRSETKPSAMKCLRLFKQGDAKVEGFH
jgi:hypothetical protein